MGERKKDTWMTGTDLEESVVENVPVPGQSVRVRGLPAQYSNEATSEALEMKQVGREQVATVNTAKLEVLQFHYGVVDPVFTREEVESIAKRFGPAFKKCVTKIDELSGVDKEAIEKAEARFPGGGEGDADGRRAGDGAPAGSS
jgi:hypothetical protein